MRVIERKKVFADDFEGIVVYNYGEINANIDTAIYVLSKARDEGAKVLIFTACGNTDGLLLQPAIERLESDEAYLMRLEFLKGKDKEKAKETIQYLKLKIKHKNI